MAKVTELGSGGAGFGARSSLIPDHPGWTPPPLTYCPLFQTGVGYTHLRLSPAKGALQLDGAPTPGFKPCEGLVSPSAGRWPCASEQRSRDSGHRQKKGLQLRGALLAGLRPHVRSARVGWEAEAASQV